METFARSVVEKFLTERLGDHSAELQERKIWMKDEVIIIQVDQNKARFDYDHFQEIAINQLGLSEWEFDYWIGENT